MYKTAALIHVHTVKDHEEGFHQSLSREWRHKTLRVSLLLLKPAAGTKRPLSVNDDNISVCSLFSAVCCLNTLFCSFEFLHHLHIWHSHTLPLLCLHLQKMMVFSPGYSLCNSLPPLTLVQECFWTRHSTRSTRTAALTTSEPLIRDNTALTRIWNDLT